MEEIITKRLILRPFVSSDCDDLYASLTQLKDGVFEGFPTLIEDGKEQLMRRLASEEYYAVERKEGGEVIGCVLLDSRPCLTKEATFAIREDFRRKGYAKEALDAIVEQAFRQGMHRIVAQCDARNEAAWKLLDKAGFSREAHYRQNVFSEKDGTGRPIWRDTYVYAKLASDF
ncbi:MAG: GNAT family N-acetyltransferase [Clostridia bacterium]|nr:GNAT family N-acetyltransferase [Clostridia bacterium]